MNILNEVYVEFLSRSSNEGFSRTVIASFISAIDPTISEVADVKTAVSEAVTNAVIHGYENGEGLIKMKCILFNDGVQVEISDSGGGIENIDEAMQPLFTSKPHLDRSGMGFTIMENFMDSIEVTSDKGSGTQVKMYKKFESLSLRETVNNEKNFILQN
jgi:stage II sporulation protein AB (anti-sigma F factor)